MNKFKEFYLKAIILLIVILAIETVVCFTVYETQKLSLFNTFYETEKIDITTSGNRLENQIDDIMAQAKKGETENFSDVLTLKGNKINIGGEEKIVLEKQIECFLTTEINFFKQSEIVIGSADTAIYLIISLKTSATEASLYYYSAEKLFGETNERIFEGIGVYNELGEKSFGSDKLSASLSKEYLTKTPEVFTTEISATKYLLSATKLDINSFLTYYTVGITNYNGAVAAIDSGLFKTSILLLIFSVMVVLVYSIFAFWLKGGHTFYEKAASKNLLYSLKLTKDGQVKKANPVFFSIFDRDINIFSKIKARSNKKSFLVGDSFIANLEDKNGAPHIINFVTTSTTNGFSLIGANLDEVLSNGEMTLNLSDTVGVEYALDKLYNKIKQSSKKLLFGVFKINNLSNLEAMFGKEFSEKVFLLMSNKIKHYFETIYTLPAEIIGVLIYNEKQVDEAITDMQEILNEINRPVLINGNLVNVGLKAGFALADSILETENFDYVERCAKAALKRVINDGNGNYYIFHESQKKLYIKYMEYNYDIEKLLSSGSFSLEFQPQYSVKERRVVGFEGLFRIKSELQLQINVFELIQFAERTGKMILLGDYIFNEGMRFAKSIEGEGVSVSINVSPIQFTQAGFVDNFLKIYNSYKLEKGSISIEVTESFLMTNFEDVYKKLEVLAKNDILVHLDDFGTSYSSFLYLKKLPISAIKIDREFIKDITTNSYSLAITKLIIELTKSLKLESIIEGVEYKEQYDIIAGLGGEVIQGYIIGKSMVAESARKLIAESKEKKLI